MTIEDKATEAGLTVHWRPFLLGPLFKSQGWDTSPFNLYPRKGTYMWRDMHRLCATVGLEFHKPNTFPQHSLLAARVALTEAVGPHIADFSRRVFKAQFASGHDIGDPAVITRIVSEIGLNADQIVANARSSAIKDALKVQTATAEQHGLFGAPSFLTPDGELFWGYDRVDQAINWIVHQTSV